MEHAHRICVGLKERRSVLRVARKEALDMFWKKPIVKPAECPACQQCESVKILKATVQAGEREEHVGWVRDCCTCGERFTALFNGRVIRQRLNAPPVLSEKHARSSDKVAGENALSSLPMDVNVLDGLL